MSAAHNDRDSACQLCSKTNPKRKGLKEHKQFNIVLEQLCKNEPTLNEMDLVVQEMLEANTADTYVGESDDDHDGW